MNTASVVAIFEFEVYLLMTMKIRMVNKKATVLEAKLAEYGFSVSDTERIHAQMTETLGDKTSRFETLKKLLGAGQDSTSLTYSSVLWPEFDFNATGEGGLLASARYWHVRGHSPTVHLPTELPAWSIDITEFTQYFGPMTDGDQWSLFDKLLPGYEEYEFEWQGTRYGAAFSWGLFLFAAEFWE